MREELREEVCKELEEDRLQTVERQVDQRFQTRWDEAAEAMAAIAQGQGSAQGSAPGSQVQQNSSNPPNNPSASQGYASSQEDRVPNSTNTQNIDLNQGIPEYAQGDVLRSVDFDDLGTLRRMLHDDEYFMLNSYHTDGSGWGQKRQVLPPIIINEGGGGRSRGKPDPKEGYKERDHCNLRFCWLWEGVGLRLFIGSYAFILRNSIKFFVVTSSFGVKLLLIAEEQFDIGRILMLIVYVIVLWIEFVSFEHYF
ncbi:hypothetical protein P8452_78149 [Trifolium repens]|nr:hypothetical protein P8452_78149 [Trifolium repens]